MPPEIRSSDVFLKTDLRNMLNALERANPQFKPAYDALRVALGIETITVTEVTTYARRW